MTGDASFEVSLWDKLEPILTRNDAAGVCVYFLICMFVV